MIINKSLPSILFSLYSLSELARIGYARNMALFPLIFLAAFISVSAWNLKKGTADFNSVLLSRHSSKFVFFWYLANLYAMSMVAVLYDPFISIFLLSHLMTLGLLGKYIGSSFYQYAFQLSSMITVVYTVFVAIVSANWNFVIFVASYLASWLCLQTLKETANLQRY